MSILRWALLVVALPSLAWGTEPSDSVFGDCRDLGTTSPMCEAQLPELGWRTLSVAELVKLKKNDKALLIFDVSGAQTRRQLGTIPGARPLDAPSVYDAHQALGSRDKCVVFYCSEPGSPAARIAAERAVAAGFTQVFVLPAGVAGWKKEAASASR